MKLAMSILVRDEAELLQANLRLHASLGVDCFVVTDNGSTDATPDVLREFARDHELLVIDEPRHDMQQDQWVERMAWAARDRLGADWILNSDADEFWLPEPGVELRSIFETDAGVLLFPRRNVLPTQADVAAADYAFHRNRWKVVRPFDNAGDYQERPWRLTEIPMTFTRLGDKAACRLAGLRSIQYGNHGAEHDAPVSRSDAVEIRHFPLRTYDEFLEKVHRHGTSLEANPALPDSIGWHVRRWSGLRGQGLLEEEYRSLVPSAERMERYRREGVVAEDLGVADRLTGIPS